ncbi:hypothetical protein SO802_010009 [Lithocarpus litseifolius]|uniref:Uncharacterized protein n=1 Tax=Lithocarpus litseifolius TaxID=425828 RepID=A0AAW2DFA0_9ROSI
MSILSSKRLRDQGVSFFLIQPQMLGLINNRSASLGTLPSIQSKGKARLTSISQGRAMEILFVTRAYGKALCLSVGEEASESNIFEAQRREVIWWNDCMAASLCPPSTVAGTCHNAMSIESRKDWDKYLQERLCKVPLRMRMLTPQTSVVIKEITESLVVLGMPAPKKVNL